MLKLCVGFMNAINDQRRSKEGIQEARLVRRGQTTHESDVDPNGGQSSGRNISSSKHEQVGSYRNNDQREDAAIIVIDGSENPGKITERLKLIERAFLSYVHDHQQRLEARLDESRTLEQNFLTAIRDLERDINSLTPEKEVDQTPNSDKTQSEQNE